MDTANHIRHFDLAGLNPEGTSQIDMKEFTVSHAVGNPCTTETKRKLSTLVALRHADSEGSSALRSVAISEVWEK